MSKDLPKVFAVPINKKINNNEETFTSLERKNSITEEIIPKSEINKIFNSKNHVYKSRINITTKESTKDYEVVGLVKDGLVTLDGQIIKIDDIIEIKKVS